MQIQLASTMNWGVAVLLLVSVIPHIAPAKKFSELLSHFKAQYFLASIVCLLLSGIAANYWSMGGAAIALIINASAIAPFYFAGVSRQHGEPRLKIALVNVNHANSAYARFVSWAKTQPLDVLVVQEINQGWADALKELDQQYPFSKVLPRNQGSGIALYSRLPMDSNALDLSEKDARPGIHASLKINDTKINDTKINIVSFHPRAPIRKGHFALRNRMLASAAACLQDLPNPKICIGDFNTSPWSHYYQNFVKQTRLKDARKGRGLLPTWPTFLIFSWLMIPIDHCLISNDICVVKMKTGEDIGSDHLPLVADLEF
jgi:endonuclease/exonuclease/phosphatase (EEP) superfamily protein YafD